MSESNIMAYVNNSFTFFKLVCYVSSLLIVFHRFFMWIALDHVELCFSLVLVTKANAVTRGNYIISPM